MVICIKGVITDYGISTCKKDILCVDCDDEHCIHQGKLHSDCPKYYCDNDAVHDCEHCEFMKNYVTEYRANLGK